MKYILSFDFSLKSTGVVLMARDGGFQPQIAETLKTTWSGSQWWAPPRYVAFFQQYNDLMQRVLGITSGVYPDLAAEAVVWDKETTPALFALHTRFWDWAWQWRTRFVYFTYQRWRNLLVEWKGISKTEASVEGKGLAMRVYKAHVGRKAPANDVSDAWGVGIAACRFYDLLDGEITTEDLRPKERQFFAGVKRSKGLEIPSGLIYERNTNYFDWTKSNGEEINQESGEEGQ